MQLSFERDNNFSSLCYPIPCIDSGILCIGLFKEGCLQLICRLHFYLHDFHIVLYFGSIRVSRTSHPHRAAPLDMFPTRGIRECLARP